MDDLIPHVSADELQRGTRGRLVAQEKGIGLL